MGTDKNVHEMYKLNFSSIFMSLHIMYLIKHLYFTKYIPNNFSSHYF